MNREAALAELAQVEQQLYAKIPADAPSWGRRHLTYVLEEHVAAARLHLRIIYDSGLEVGPGFTAVAASATHPRYAFWLEGVQRHLEICAASFEGGPQDEGDDAGD